MGNTHERRHPPDHANVAQQVTQETPDTKGSWRRKGLDLYG